MRAGRTTDDDNGRACRIGIHWKRYKADAAAIAGEGEAVMARYPTEDLTGRIFGRWHVLKRVSNKRYGSTTRTAWLCQCECGTQREVLANALLREKSLSCGCYKEELSHVARTHGDARRSGRTPEFQAWTNMRSRCLNPNTPKWKNHGGRGITICPQWDSYEQFLTDMGRRPTVKHSLDRIDNDGPYSPENCRWATDAEQTQNMRKNRYITFQGRTQILALWAREYNIHPSAFHARFSLGWPMERIISTPVRFRTVTKRGT